MPFQFQHLAIPGVILVEARRYPDDRGFFLETYKLSEFTELGIPGPFVQDNWSHSRRGTLRGLHYQKQPKAQGKLVMVTGGEVLDVAVDIRRGSPTYGQWVSLVLTAGSGHALYVPPGFAHGFCVLSETADVIYKVTEEYAPALDRGILWCDPEIGVQWPVASPLLSPKDAALPLLRDADHDFVWE
ncbi:MAG TPA: dTDP-4-dehydrorhamnose 3,5-epimerase [Anaerolineae bacterium]|nr:dTDP-4-dehydrorhamnose 3,5-epimerase [Anaerolineae bacterium]